MGGYGHRIRVLGAERQRRAGRLRLGDGDGLDVRLQPRPRPHGGVGRVRLRAGTGALLRQLRGGQTARGAVDRQRARRTDRRATRDRRGPPRAVGARPAGELHRHVRPHQQRTVLDQHRLRLV